jgi:catechol 2,3-dioxygenase-like lactoylglutathione lyase family enzyme
MPTITGFHHLALTVTDVERSQDWYAQLLDMKQVLGGDEDTVLWRVLHHADSNLLLGLRQYLDGARPEDRFDELRMGLDHLAFGVATRNELMEWQRRVEDLGIPHTPVVDTPVGSVLVLRDPDNIQLEFFSNPGT